MSWLEYIKLAIDVGAKVIQLAAGGKNTIRVSDVLPTTLHDREKLRQLAQQAESDYRKE